VLGILIGVVAFKLLPNDNMDAMAARASGSQVTDANAGDSAIAPSKTVILRGDDSLTPDPAGTTFSPGESVAFVVTNAADTPRTFTVGESAIEVPAGTTSTLVYRFANDDVPYSWGGGQSDVLRVGMAQHG